MNPLLQEFQAQTQEVFSLAQQDLKGIKTGRAKPSLVEDVRIQAYNSTMTLKELASITAPDPAQIIISPWDKSLLETISKGISLASLNLNPVVDGEIIRISIPPLTQESREELVKLVHQKLESMRAMLRQARNEAKEKIESRKNEAGVSEDDIHRDLDELQKMTDEAMNKLDEMSKTKETELMSI
ncbi:ribosome recycling factor [Candidatus Beckwithbacteria bacterium RBG_13_42_9]|uniref:Ribosome-recycling factor n=1 Tax=Candidatus Beckwithbacteria bacterium RBG_13_42_9 TaxID=1797457 RepID=A0A1F5E8G2_9BACT|nr:MAG: ribosome recycling factor [Candidatus Beckwithbacteria bacterium RBG_13_42_9]